jgi:hypothetical protein
METSWPPSDSVTRTSSAAADEGAGGWRLREDVIGRDAGGVKAVLDREVQAELLGCGRGVRVGEPGKRGDANLAAVDGQAE